MTAEQTLVCPPEIQSSPFRARFSLAEDWLVTLALAAIVAVPLMEAVLRLTLERGMSGSSTMIQHLTLIIGMLGAAIAARQNRLLSLSTVAGILPQRWKATADIFSAACAAAVCAWLAVGAGQFVQAEREAGGILVYGIPRWTVQTILPLGFAVITLRLLWHAAPSWRGRAFTAVLAAALTWAGSWLSVTASIIILLAASVLGVPAFVTLGGVGLILFWGMNQPIASIAIDHYSLVINPSLPTLPLFTLAGYFLAEGGAPRRLIRVFGAWFAPLPGGSAMVVALACSFFTCFTGASGVTIIAIGGLLMPVLLAERYSERNALGLVTGAGSLGLLFPPCLPLILYAIVAKVPMKDIFLGGIGPGIIMVAAVIAWGVYRSPKASGRERPAFRWLEARQSLWEAKWELMMPVVAFVALFGGFATPVEAAAATALYAFFIETVIHRDLRIGKDLPRVMSECGLLVGGVLVILGVALGITNYLVDTQFTARLVEWTTQTIHSRWVFLLALNIFLLVVGCLMDIYSAIVIQAPLLVPIALAYGIDPVHLGIIFLANLELGYLTPPVGLNLFLSALRFKKPLPEVMRAVLPIVVVLGAGVLLITYVPALTTALPRWFGK